jgi:PAS domain S-box-containing protein
MSSDLETTAPKLPGWASDSELYKYQVRQSTKYAMFALDPEGYLLTWNEGVLNILGYSEEEWVGKHASLIFTPKEHAYEVCASELKLAAEQGFSSDIRWHLRKDGTELFAHGYITALRVNGGELLGYSKILSDETKNKQLQDSLTESNMALEQFAHIASHDLQEPLRTVGTFAELLATRYRDKLDQEAAGFLDLIVNGSKRMGTLIQDLLSYARVQTEIDRPTSYSLDQDLESALSQLQALIDTTHAVVTHDPLPTIQVDQGQMVRLFQNLVGNAVKYAKPGVPPSIHLSATQEGSDWVITVKDNGIGFEQKFAKEIFLPFKRLHGQTEYPGTGVGLAICRRIVERHGGRIWAESQPGEGSSFHFALPVGGKTPQRHTPPVTSGL